MGNGVPPSGSGHQPTASAANASSQSGVPNADELRIVAERFCPADFEPIVKRAAEDFYERVMNSCEDYLRDNVQWNIGAQIDMLVRENQRMRTELHEVDSILGPPWLTPTERIERLRALDAAKRELVALKYEAAFPAQAMSAGTAETAPQAQGEARQRGPKDAPTPSSSSSPTPHQGEQS